MFHLQPNNPCLSNRQERVSERQERGKRVRGKTGQTRAGEHVLPHNNAV